MNRCGTCKWWDHPDAPYGGEPGYYLRKDVGVQSCLMSAGRADQSGPFMEAGAADDWGAVLLTTADFGCVLWEEG